MENVRRAVSDRFLWAILLVFGLFWIRGVLLLDPDFGWHLKFGEIVNSTGIPKTDPFSYTMPSFHHVNHEWFLDGLIAKLYPKIGFYGLSAIYTLIFISAFMIAMGRRGWREKVIILLLFSAPISSYFGVRHQVVSWLFLAITLRFLYDTEKWKRLRYFSPIFFLIWANLHGGFVAGLISVALVFVVRTYQKRKIDKIDLFLILLSIIVTLINPYGLGLWREVWSSVSDSALRYRVVEWKPLLFNFDISLFGLMGMSLASVWIYKRQIALERIVIYLFFLSQVFMSNRNIPLWGIASIFIISDGFRLLKERSRSVKDAPKRYSLAVNVLLFISILVFGMKALTWIKEIKLEYKGFYPIGAVDYLDQSEVNGQMFTNYGWGGYVIWKLPSTKTFVDGRMPSWRNTDVPPNETVSAMDDYVGMLKGDLNIEKEFKKYNIETFMWSGNKSENSASSFETKIIQTVFGEEAAKVDIDIEEELLKLGWHEVYRDDVAVVLKKDN